MRASRLSVVWMCCCLSVSCAPDTTWREAFDARSSGWVMNAWGPAPDRVYAVGGTLTAGTIRRFDGSTWRDEPTGQSDVALLNWAHGTGPSDVWVVGAGGAILHFDGAVWTRAVSPVDQTIWGVWAASASDVWAVGGNGRSPGDALLVHYDGAVWTRVPTPVIAGLDYNAIFKVWGTAADDVWAVGQRGVVLHFDGVVWTGEQLATSNEDLISVWGTSRTSVVAVGGRSNGVAAHFDGARWRVQRLSPLPGLNGVWMRDATTAHAVGAMGTILVLDVPSLMIREDASQATRLDYHSVFGVGSRLFAVGGNLSIPAPPLEGVASTRNL